MSTASAYLTVAGLGVDVVYKDIKNLHISVYPPMGRVRVAAPERTDEDTIRLAVVQRLPWIKRQREQLQKAERQTERADAVGRDPLRLGSALPTRRLPSSGSVRCRDQGQDPLGDHASRSRRRRAVAALDRWYRRQLKAALPPLLDKWQPIIGVEADKVVVRRMKTKWGTCVTASRTIWLNPELAKKNPRCLEYIVVHELTHLLERGHGERFVALMDSTCRTGAHAVTS